MAKLRMPSVNNLTISGRVTREPKRGVAPSSGAPWCKFSIAHDTFSKGEKSVAFWDVSTFGKTAEIAQELRKGAPVIVEGSLSRDCWTDKQGQKREPTRIIGRRISRLAWPDDQEPQQEQAPAPGNDPVPNDDVPF